MSAVGNYTIIEVTAAIESDDPATMSFTFDAPTGCRVLSAGLVRVERRSWDDSTHFGWREGGLPTTSRPVDSGTSWELGFTRYTSPERNIASFYLVCAEMGC